MHRLPFLLVAALLLVAGRAASGQTLDAGPQVLTFFSDVDDTEQPYGLYLPPNYDPSRAYPLVVSLHGAGSNHRLNLRRVFGKSNADGENDVEASRYFPEWEDVDFIVATPYARGTMGYQGVAEKDVLNVLADVKRRFSVDEDRVYLTGLSMGGGGTLWIGLTRPALWAAIAPVCPAAPPGSESFAPNALHLPVRIFQGAADPVVRPEVARAWVERLEGVGTEVTYDEYPGVEHDSWVPAYADGQVFDWFDQFERDLYPDRVRFVTDRYAYDDAYWVRVDGLTPGVLARVDAEVTGDNELRVVTSELKGFTLNLDGHPRYEPGQPFTVEIDGTRLDVPAAEVLSFRQEGGAWVAEPYLLAEAAKRPGVEGPIGAALAERHVYVYGTGGDASPEEVAERRAQAEKAAEWSVNRGPFMRRVMVFPRVLADREVRPSDLDDANLILFGTAETNSLVERFEDELPIHLSEEAEGYGLVYVYPRGDQYTVVSSGLPWWQPDPEAPGEGSPFTRDVVAFGLMGLGDYLLFEGSANNAVAKGRFDSAWRLSPAAAKAMRATGAVRVADKATAELEP